MTAQSDVKLLSLYLILDVKFFSKFYTRVYALRKNWAWSYLKMIRKIIWTQIVQTLNIPLACTLKPWTFLNDLWLKVNMWWQNNKISIVPVLWIFIHVRAEQKKLFSFDRIFFPKVEFVYVEPLLSSVPKMCVYA